MQAGVHIGVVVAFAEPLLQPRADGFVDQVEARQAERGHKGADKALTRQVHPFPEHAAQHRKADALAGGVKLPQPGVALGLRHLARLRPDRNAGMTLPQPVQGHVHVIEAAEKSQVVAGLLRELGRQRLHQQVQGVSTVIAPGRDRFDLDRELRGIEGARDVEQLCAVGQAQQIDVVIGRVERGREQHHRIGHLDARRDKVAGHDIAQRQAARCKPGVVRRQAFDAGLRRVGQGRRGKGRCTLHAVELAHRVRAKHVGQRGKTQGIKIERQQRTLRLGRVLVQILADGAV